MIRPKKVGHVVLKVRDTEQAERFYTEVLGFEVVARLSQPRGVFFSLGEQHHDLAVLEVSPHADEPKADQVGLHHVALQVEDFAALKEWYRTLQRHGVAIVRAVDHGVTKSIYFCDPAGNRLELYCDVGEDGRARMRDIGGLTLADFPPLSLED
ncbi:MAG: VOC family protein [Thermodesulfobacteriota bacterium]|jgi:catechol-2,3-dioxygenase